MDVIESSICNRNLLRDDFNDTKTDCRLEYRRFQWRNGEHLDFSEKSVGQSQVGLLSGSHALGALEPCPPAMRGNTLRHWMSLSE
ncbi:hypothetical protein TNCV_57231 [Trichonephila clavipes]|nr:hypothetical protein TNCV_57231 [Trichonephila clavipes]